ncbi:hypothetical protein LPTSP3_g28910 [Leptospira kobayashii]|uniref:Uncharacterized protein n=1 Tax=Leptospira kobayashii TaxID=1917830 RepID=A0ABM7ULT9_9LEPT|nr:hypothetical protein [Leptospira kobayashii]BDA79961.1 hypothetical protein LPTSP3_g28910 [Leptospira kobayashii]
MKEIRYYVKRIAEFPKFQTDPNTLDLLALWNDALIRFTNEINNSKHLSRLKSSLPSDKNLQGLHTVIIYIISDKEWEKDGFPTTRLMEFLITKLPELAKSVSPYTEWIHDNERSEELIRALFSALELLPDQEDKKYFEDRLRSIDTIERIKILEESKKAQERAKEILERMKRAEEEEAASKYNRE